MWDETMEQAISAYYGPWGLMERIEQALRSAGIEPEQVTVRQLAPLDNFHSFGIAGTRELANLANITADDAVLDVGGGLGGPARVLASERGCMVTVLDLTAEFCRVGERLTTWTHLSDRVSFVNASALEMPFAPATFDVVWTQHASMNIADKRRLYEEVHRVLRPGGRFALFDLMAGPEHPPHFPVPWADDPAYSHLLPPEEARSLVLAAGFTECVWRVGADVAAALEQATGLGVGGVLSPSQLTPGLLSPGLLMGASGAEKMRNAGRNTSEGRTVLVLGVFECV